jgi:hypothetical protein
MRRMGGCGIDTLSKKSPAGEPRWALTVQRPSQTVQGSLLTQSPVDPLPQEVGVAVVSRILLDHVHQDLTE